MAGYLEDCDDSKGVPLAFGGSISLCRLFADSDTHSADEESLDDMSNAHFVESCTYRQSPGSLALQLSMPRFDRNLSNCIEA